LGKGKAETRKARVQRKKKVSLTFPSKTKKKKLERGDTQHNKGMKMAAEVEEGKSTLRRVGREAA